MRSVETLVAAAATALALLAAPPSPSAGAPKITLRWTTASEQENYGFFVMRAEKEGGPWTAVNARVIAGAGTSEVPRDYLYEDAAVVPGQMYWYRLESVSTRGDREPFSPVFSKRCCAVPASPSPQAPR